DRIKAVNQKVASSRSADERKALEDYHKDGVKQIARAIVPDAAIYALACRPDGKSVAAAGADGFVRLYDAADGKLVKQFAPAPRSADAPPVAVGGAYDLGRKADDVPEAEKLPAGSQV